MTDCTTGVRTRLVTRAEQLATFAVGLAYTLVLRLPANVSTALKMVPARNLSQATEASKHRPFTASQCFFSPPSHSLLSSSRFKSMCFSPFWESLRDGRGVRFAVARSICC